MLGGDYVNRGPQQRAVLERVAALGLPAISGNHDTWLAMLARGQNLPAEWESAWWTPVRRAVAELTPEWVTWLEALPFSLRLELPGAEPVLIVHGSPRHAREGMGRMRSDAQVAEALAGVEERTVIGAHIHYPYERAIGQTSRGRGGRGRVPFQRRSQCPVRAVFWDVDGWRFEHRSASCTTRSKLYAAWRESGYFDDGSLATELMMLENQTAAPTYVPFWDWALSARPAAHAREFCALRRRTTEFVPPAPCPYCREEGAEHRSR